MKRFALPDTALLDAIHTTCSEYYTKNSNPDPKENLMGKLNGEIMMMLGILIQELIRSKQENTFLTNDQVHYLAPNLVDLFGEEVM